MMKLKRDAALRHLDGVAHPVTRDMPYTRAAIDPFTLGHKLERLAWQLSWALLARWTPPKFAPWRRWLLRRFGADLTGTADVRGTAQVWFPRNLTMGTASILAQGVNCYNQGLIQIGERVTVSQGAYLCGGSHEVDTTAFTWFAAPITVEDGAWVAAEAFIGPGVTVGSGAVLGARAVTMRDVPPMAIYVGNPAQLVRMRRLETPHGG